jgi:predicted transcriptional regulator
LAEQLQLDPGLVHNHLINLRLLGLIKLIDGAETVPLTGLKVQEKVSRKSNEFLRASRAAGEIQRISGKLPKIKQS